MGPWPSSPAVQLQDGYWPIQVILWEGEEPKTPPPPPSCCRNGCSQCQRQRDFDAWVDRLETVTVAQPTARPWAGPLRQPYGEIVNLADLGVDFGWWDAQRASEMCRDHLAEMGDLP